MARGANQAKRSARLGRPSARSSIGSLLLLAACSPGAFNGLSGGSAVSDAAGASDAATPLDDAETRDASVPSQDVDATVSAEAGSDAASVDGALDAAPGLPADAAVLVDGSADSALDATSPTDGSTPPQDTGAADAGPTTRSFPIATDVDDALWYISGANKLEELLHFSEAAHNSAGYTIEVGTDGEQCRAGLRFQLPLGRGARIVAATLTLTRVGPQDDADPFDTIRVHVYDADTVGAFDGAHVHSDPKEHVAGGLWSKSVGGFHVGRSYTATESGDLSELLQHVIDRPGWTRNAYLGFVLTPDQMPAGDYAQFADQVEDDVAPATLKLTYFDAP